MNSGTGADYKIAFRYFDAQKNGVISREDVIKVMTGEFNRDRYHDEESFEGTSQYKYNTKHRQACMHSFVVF